MIIENKQIGDYEVSLKDTGEINCTCKFASLYPNAYMKGEKICKHIQKFIKEHGKT